MKPISRLGIGSRSLIQLVLALVLFLSAAYLSANYFKVWDFSKDQDYTLSDLSQKILARPALSEREDPVRITVAFRKSSPYYQRVKRSVEEFVRESKGNITAQFLDPVREPDAASQFASTFNLTLNSDLILIDARPKGSTQPDPNLTRSLWIDDLIIFRTDQNNQRRPVGFQIEDRLATQLLSIAEGAPRKLYFSGRQVPRRIRQHRVPLVDAGRHPPASKSHPRAHESLGYPVHSRRCRRGRPRRSQLRPRGPRTRHSGRLLGAA